jgi:hypothetical protein
VECLTVNGERLTVNNVVYTHEMTTDDRPKSAVELAMERLRQKDADSGVAERPPTDKQKAAIAEARNLHASKVAELEILQRSKMASVFDAAGRAQAEEAYRRDLTRLHDELERKIGKIRTQGD